MVQFVDTFLWCVCVEMKRLTHEKMKEMEELMSKKEHPDTERYKAALEKGQANLEKYKKMTIMAQNVLRVNKLKNTHCLSVQCLKTINSYNEMCSQCINISVSLQGVLLACKVNWMDDPQLRDIAMTLEEFPISE